MRHAHAAVADQRDDAPLAVDERRRERGREAIAHRARGGAEERAGPPEPEPAGSPAGERPGVGGEDGVLGQQPPEVRDDPAGMDARAAPVAAVDDGGRLPGRAIGGVVPVARARRGSASSTPVLEARDGRPQEGPGVGPDRQLRARRRSPTGPDRGSRSTCIQRWPIARDAVLEGGGLAQPGPEDQERVRGLEPLADRPRAAEAGHAQVERVVVGDDVAAPPAGDHRARAAAPRSGRGRWSTGRAGRRRRRG